MTNELFKKYLANGDIKFYEQQLIEKLRNLTFQGVPLSLIVLCFEIRNGNCYTTAINLTRGMDKFKLVIGNIDEYPIEKYPNHSWVEKDGFIYDPTDGFKYDKNLYYKMYNASEVFVYDENNCYDYKLYREVVENNILDLKNLPLILQYIELQEKRLPTINHELLLREIEEIRNKFNIITRYSSKVMDDMMRMMK